MADLEDIVQNVGISGTDDVTAAFKLLAASVESSVGSLQSTIESSFTEIVTQGKKVTEQTTELGQALSDITGIVAATVAGIIALSAGIGAMAKSAGDAVTSLGRLGEELGTTVEGVSGLLSAFAASGASTDGLALAFKRLSNSISNDWPAIEKAVASSADNISKSELKVQDATLNVISTQLQLSQSAERAQLSVSESFENLKSATFSLQQAWNSSIQSMQTNSLSLRGATLSVTGAEQALQTLLGNPPTDGQKQQLAIEEARLNLSRAQQAQRDAAQKQIDDSIASEIAIEKATLNQQKANLDAAEAVSKARIQQTKDTLDAEKAQLEFNAAVRSQNETLLSDIPTISREIKAVEDGSGGLAKNFDLSRVSVDNLAKSVIATAAKGDIVNGLVKPTSVAVLNQVSNLFQHLDDNTTKTALSMKLFGRGVQQDLVDALSKGSGAIDDYVGKQTAANLVINDADLAIGQNLHSAFNTLGNDLSIAAEKFALAFGPTILGNIKALDDGLRSLSADGSLKTFADTLAKGFTALEDGIQAIVSGFKAIYNGIASVAGERTAFTGLGIVLTGIGIIVLLLLGPFIAWTIIIAAVIIAIGLIAENWDKISAAVSAKVTEVTDWFKQAWDGATTYVQQAFASLGQYINSTWVGSVIAGITKAAAAIKNLFSSSTSSATANAPSPSPNNDAPIEQAGGGHITGPGTSKSDSIHAMLSTGEFVVQAPAVAKVGLGFMHALNNMSVPKFAGGGYIASSATAPSSSGSSSRTLHLTIGGQTFKGMTAPEDIVPALRTASVRAQMTSNGRKAAWAS